MANAPAAFVYRGPGLPIKRSSDGFLNFKTDRDLIKDSLRQILGTHIGERVMVPEFGSRIPELVFEPDDNILVDLAKLYIQQSIGRWEPRIVITNVGAVVDNDHSTLNLVISYYITKINTNDSLQYQVQRNGQ